MAKEPKQIKISFVPHDYQGQLVEQRVRDGYINATAMCKVAGREFGHYNANVTTRAYLAELSSEIGIPISELIQAVSGGNPARQGTWVHPQVAIHLGQWLSPKFAVLVSNWVYDWMSSGALPKSPSLPFHLRRYMTNQKERAAGTFFRT